MQFYADAHSDQAKPITKTDAHAAIERFLRHLDRRNFFRVRFSTGFAPPVHRFSTLALTPGPARSPGTVKCAIV